MVQTRYENKLVCDEQYLPDARAWVRLHPAAFSIAHPPRQINNLYFDTREADCLQETLDGSKERGKLRLRWYGTSFANIQGTLELKRKSNRQGWKALCVVPTSLDLTTISWKGLMQQLRRHAEGQVEIWLTVADQPILINSFTREYYESEDQRVRLTIDRDHMAFEQWMQPRPNLSLCAVRAQQVVIEIKVDSRHEDRLEGISSPFPLRVGQNSKYVTGILDAFEFLNRFVR